MNEINSQRRKSLKGTKKGDKVVVSWLDNTGDKNSAEAAIG
ncbi:MAG: hypothetical protein Q8Q28_13580 [Pseudomonadota bacterium]|nr:hypothetical protein [Pseudomonadota bacterium]